MAEAVKFTKTCCQDLEFATKFNIDTIKDETTTEQFEFVECYNNNSDCVVKTEDEFNFDEELISIKDESLESQLGAGYQLKPEESEEPEKKLEQCNETELTEKSKQCNNVPMVIIYRCNICSYKTKYKEHLDEHMPIHHDFQVALRKCKICGYKTMQMPLFRSHMLMHRSASETPLYKCDQCSYKAKVEKYLKQHMLLHKDASELKMYQCEECKYRSKRKADLQHHMLSHQRSLSGKMYQCKVCEHKVKYKSHLKMHMMTHK